ncbi:HipA family kinase [Salinivirga cyanobacteriivorans]|uniref:HipA family kinase n=1 Tax=Salinivirga cyanobacteriivorans TaxID=1307839 RepID=UPI003AAC7BC9
MKLCLFDIWVENDDRKPTNPNVLFDVSGDKIGIVAIDNAFTFTSQNYDSLYVKGVTQSINDNLLYTEFVKKIYHYIKNENGWIDYIKEYFYICIQNCKENFNEIIENIPTSLGLTDELKEHLYNFLFNDNRNQIVLQDFYSRL